MKKLYYTGIESNIKGIIEEEIGIGAYLYIYELESGKSIADHLQDSIELAIEQAEEDYGIPRDSWKLLP